MSVALGRRQLLAAGLALPASALLAHCTPKEVAPSPPPARAREVQARIDAQPTIEGAGVHLFRSLGSAALAMLDPFLLLDEIRSDRPEDYLPGFPSHPHRGFETVTYMIEGAMEHRDSLGNHGRLVGGSTQWMTAGHGIVHSEMPRRDGGMLWGLQLWVNLPSAQKLIRPRYQDLAPERIASLHVDDATVRLVAGELDGQRGPVDGIVTAPQMLDVTLPARGTMRRAVPRTHNAFVYVLEGRALVGDARAGVDRGQLAVLGPGDVVTLRSDGGARLLLLAGQPIGEPVARYGPFVMNTDAELQQAIDDYRSGRLVEG